MHGKRKNQQRRRKKYHVAHCERQASKLGTVEHVGVNRQADGAQQCEHQDPDPDHCFQLFAQALRRKSLIPPCPRYSIARTRRAESGSSNIAANNKRNFAPFSAMARNRSRSRSNFTARCLSPHRYAKRNMRYPRNGRRQSAPVISQFRKLSLATPEAASDSMSGGIIFHGKPICNLIRPGLKTGRIGRQKLAEGISHHPPGTSFPIYFY